MKKKINSPKAFISYSWSSPQHEEWVLELAEKLRSDGVDIILDKWDLKEGHDKYDFMEKMVNDSNVNKVLIICDEAYAKKANMRKGGVGTETQIISAEIYEQVIQEKFIPVVSEVDADGKPFLPTFINSRIYIDLSIDENYYQEYEKLLRNIFDRPAIKKPPLGTPPSYLSSSETIIIKTGHKFSSVQNALTNNNPNKISIVKDYLECFLEALEDFRFDDSKRPNEGYDDLIVESIRSFKPYRDEFAEFVKLVSLYPDEEETFESIFEFFEKTISFLYQEQARSYHKVWYDNYRFVLRELFVYLIAVLIKNKKFERVNYFLNGRYYYIKDGVRTSSTFAVFDVYIGSLDNHRKNRLQLRRATIVADMLKERSDLKGISFDDIIQADFILFIYYYIYKKENSFHWYPRTSVHIDIQQQPFELFFKASSKKHFNALKTLFGINSGDEFISHFNKAYENSEALQGLRIDMHHPVSYKSLLNLDNLYKE